MRKILIVGSGAREHILAEKCKESRHSSQIFTYGPSQNPGLERISEAYEKGEISDHENLLSFAKKHEVDFAIIGPEAPLAAGLVDVLEVQGIACFGPTKELSQIESSKGFARDLLVEFGIPGNPEFKVFKSEEGIREFLNHLGGEYVIKADDLRGGKGVKLSGEHLSSLEEGLAYAKECIETCGQVLVEEKMLGEEFSLMSFVSGESCAHMPLVQDHKRAFEGDKGPNTGGMGSYSQNTHGLSFISDEDLKTAREINEAVAIALNKKFGKAYKGVLYGGFMAVKNGVRLVEYNARFGDPEAMNVLSLLKSDFIDVCEAVFEKRLSSMEIEFEQKATVVKYTVPNGYPDESLKSEISFDENQSEAKVYFGSIEKSAEGKYLLLGSRALAFLGKADTLEEAESIAEKASNSVRGNVFHRKDIGRTELVKSREAHMNHLRGFF